VPPISEVNKTSVTTTTEAAFNCGRGAASCADLHNTKETNLVTIQKKERGQ
jgi:hypothetical protein